MFPENFEHINQRTGLVGCTEQQCRLVVTGGFSIFLAYYQEASDIVGNWATSEEYEFEIIDPPNLLPIVVVVTIGVVLAIIAIVLARRR